MLRTVCYPLSNIYQRCYYTDAGDDSLQRYKESLGLGGGKDLSDPNDPRVCIIESLTMESPGRDPVTIDLSQPGSEATLKNKPFRIKAGAKFTMVVKFRVQHEILSGLQYVQVVKRRGIRVSKDSEMLVSTRFLICLLTDIVRSIHSLLVVLTLFAGKLCPQHRQDPILPEAL